MSLSNTLENEILEHILNNADIANIGDATGLRGSATAGSLYIALHTAPPGEGGSQTTNECAYTSYTRVAVARSGALWTVTLDTAENASQIAFPQATGGSETATDFTIGTSSTGAGKIILAASLTTPLAISTGITPTFAAGALTVTAA